MGATNEFFRPPSNLPPGNDIKSKIRYFIRSHLDFMVASLLQHLVPWLLRCSGKVLEVGCGAQPYRHLIPSTCVYQGIDHELSKNFSYEIPNTLYYVDDKFPLSDNSVDHLFHTEVMEHVFDTSQFLRECNRVLKNGGSMFFSVPFQYRYHYIPYDYWRFTPAALHILLEKAGFKDIVVMPRGTDITVISHKMVVIMAGLLRSNLLAKMVGIIISPLVLVILLIGNMSMRLNIGSQDDCLGYNIITVKA